MSINREELSLNFSDRLDSIEKTNGCLEFLDTEAMYDVLRHHLVEAILETKWEDREEE